MSETPEVTPNTPEAATKRHVRQVCLSMGMTCAEFDSLDPEQLAAVTKAVGNAKTLTPEVILAYKEALGCCGS